MLQVKFGLLVTRKSGKREDEERGGGRRKKQSRQSRGERMETRSETRREPQTELEGKIGKKKIQEVETQQDQNYQII